MSDISQKHLHLICAENLVDFLEYAIETTGRISGDHDGEAGLTYLHDSYEKIAKDYLQIKQESHDTCFIIKMENCPEDS